MASSNQSYVTACLLLLIASSYAQKDQRFFRSDYTYLQETESFYKIHWWGASNFNDEIEACNTESATLFYPQDEREANAVIDFWKKTQPSLESVSVGIGSFIVEGVYGTIDGQSMSDIYEKWGPGQPSANEGCVELRQDGTYADVNCFVQKAFICRKRLAQLNWNYACNMPDMDYVYDSTVGKCYKFHLKPADWVSAALICDAEQSYLATMNSLQERSALVKVTANAPKDEVQGNFLRGAVHLGFLKFQDWVNLDGVKIEEAGFPAWEGGQPDNAGGNEECGSMFYTGELNDISCDQELFFICEHDL